MVKRNRTRRQPRSVHEWMLATRTNGRQLILLLREQGVVLSEPQLSKILKGSQRCSLKLAVKLHQITGVEIADLAEWPRVPKWSATSGVASR